MMLEHKKASTYSCKECTVQLAQLRNCNDLPNSKAKNFINNHIYTTCPKRIYSDSHEARYLVELYLECRESKVLPYPGSMQHQTEFTRDLFVFLDEIVAEWRKKKQEEANKKAPPPPGK